MSIRSLVKPAHRLDKAPAASEETLLKAMKSVFQKDVEALVTSKVDALESRTDENVMAAVHAIVDGYNPRFADLEDRLNALTDQFATVQAEFAALKEFMAKLTVTVNVPLREKVIQYENGFPVRTIEKDLDAAEPKPAKPAELFGRKALPDATEPEVEIIATPNGEAHA